MTFIETFGGEWLTKSQMSAGDAFKFLQVVPKLQLSAKFMAKMGAAGASGKPMKSTITEVGDGIYSFYAEVGDMTADARFTLDGKPMENSRMYDNKKLMISCTFEDGVWTMENESEGCIKIVNVFTRVGDEIHNTEKYGDFDIKKVFTKS